MKTSKTLSSSFAKAITFATFVLTATLFISSCQKDEEFNPGKPQTATVNEKRMDAPLPPLPKGKTQIATINEKSILIHERKLAFASITIDHYAAATSLPDYSVTVSANGTATYQGRNNVDVKGMKMLEVSDTQLAKINNLLLRLIDLPDDKEHSNDVGKLFPQPTNRTTVFSQEKAPLWSLSDNNTQPKWLVAFRTQVEKELNIARFINAPGQIAQINK